MNLSLKCHILKVILKFVVTCLISSQVCQYFENVVNMVKLIKQLRFCAGSNPACGVLEIRDGEDL